MQEQTVIYWGLLQQSDLPIHKFTVSLLLYYLCYHLSLGRIRHSTSNLESFQSLSPESQSSLLYAHASLFPAGVGCLSVHPCSAGLSTGETGKAWKLLLWLRVAPSPSFLTWSGWGQHHAQSWGQGIYPPDHTETEVLPRQCLPSDFTSQALQALLSHKVQCELPLLFHTKSIF